MSRQFRKSIKHFRIGMIVGLSLILLNLLLLQQVVPTTYKHFIQSNSRKGVHAHIETGDVYHSNHGGYRYDAVSPDRDQYNIRRAIDARSVQLTNTPIWRGMTSEKYTADVVKQINEQIKLKRIFCRNGRVGYSDRIDDKSLIESIKRAIDADDLVTELHFDERIFTERNPRLHSVKFLAKRGEIYDRNNRPIAQTHKNDAGRLRRNYPLGEKGFHISGYLGHPLDPGVSEGMESVANSVLKARERSTPDRISNILKGNFSSKKKGRNIDLTIDAELQNYAFSHPRFTRGAIIVLDVKTGELLAAVCKPSLNPNGGKRQWLDALDNVGNARRFVRRAWQEIYNPGSTFKLIDTIIALENGIISPVNYQEFRIQCSGKYLAKRLKRGMRNSPRGNFSLSRAFAISHNEFFARLVAEQMGAGVLQRGAEKLRYFEDFSLIPPSETGLTDNNLFFTVKPNQLVHPTGGGVPSLDQFGLSLSAIGQRDVKVTPLYMAFLAAAIANGGSAPAPYIVKAITEPEPEYQVIENFSRAENVRLMSAQTAEVLGGLMHSVTADSQGTAYRAFQGLEIPVAGKTGTAEVEGYGSRPDTRHAWFVGYAPVAEPKIAISVVVEHVAEKSGNTGGNIAAPIARDLISSVLLNVQATDE